MKERTYWQFFMDNLRFHYGPKEVKAAIWGFLYMCVIGAVFGGLMCMQDPQIGCSASKGAFIGAAILGSVRLLMELYFIWTFGNGPDMPSNPDLW